MQADIFGCEIELDEERIDASRATIRRQLAGYEAGRRQSFDLPIAFPKTPAGAIQRTISQIPYGQTRTYGEIADATGTAPIAVGSANAANAIPVILPCHRVVGTDSLRGYRYPGLKERLLRHENEAGVEALPYDTDGTI